MSSWWKNLFRGKGTSTSAAAETSAPLSERPRAVRRVTLGVDFGTSTTKCCFREQAERKPVHVVGFETVHAADSRVLLPTTVAIDAGRLFFGHTAEHCDAREKFRSIKMCLLCLLTPAKVM